MKRIILIGLISVLILGLVSAAYATTEYTERLAGADRIETAIEISNEIYDDGCASDCHVVLCRSDNFPDSLAASSIAGVDIWEGDYEDQELRSAVILLTPSNELDERVKDEIERLFDSCPEGVGGMIDIIGGTGAISEDVEDELKDMDCVEEVNRIGGKDRYETAVKIADELEDRLGDVDAIFVVTGENFPDAMSVAGWSYFAAFEADMSVPMLLVKKDEIPGPTLDWLLAHKNDMEEVAVIGGPGVISSDVMEDLGYYLEADIERVAGDNRYETCVEVAEHYNDYSGGEDPEAFIFATGNNWPDALTGAGLMQIGPMPLMLTSSIDESIEEYLSDIFDGFAAEEDSYVLGGTGAVSKTTEDDIAELLSDGDFEPTTEEPTINSFDVTINPDNDLPDVAQYDSNDEVEFNVETDERIWNEDGLLGKVVVEDISELGGKEAPYNEDDFELGWDYGDDASDNGFSDSVLVKKKSTDPDQREVTFVARATNQAGSDTMESDSIEIYN